MNKEQFYGWLEEEIGKEFPQYTLRRDSNIKNGGVVVESLTILDPAKNISPSLRISDLWSDYDKAGRTDESAEKILKNTKDVIVASFERVADPDVAVRALSIIEDWRSRVITTLVLKDGNETYLDGKVWKPFLDMAKVYRIVIEPFPGDDGIGSVTVDKRIFDEFGVTLDELDAIATENTFKRLPVTIESIEQVLANMMGVSEEEFRERTGREDAKPLPMYVISNVAHIWGATAVVLDEALKNLCERIKTEGVYILPSSIHEVIAIPAYAAPELDRLKEMVEEVNGKEVPPDELLSGNVYYYEPSYGQLWYADRRYCFEPDKDVKEEPVTA